MPTLAGLDPTFRPFAQAFFDWAKSLGAPVQVTSARRTYQEQASLFAAYQAGTPGLYTVLPPGQSMHELGFAFDMATPGVEPKADPWLAYLGPLWRSQMHGIWGGEADPVHFEASPALSGRGTAHDPRAVAQGAPQAPDPTPREARGEVLHR